MSLIEYQSRDGSVRLSWHLHRTPKVVWQHLVDLDHLPEWLGTATEGGFEVGHTLVVDHGDGYLCRSDIRRSDPWSTLDMTWHFPDEPPTRITISLVPETSRPPESAAHHEWTRLQLLHADLGNLAHDYLAGWVTHLTFFEASLVGAPLPTSAFWPICSTNAQLTAR